MNVWRYGVGNDGIRLRGLSWGMFVGENISNCFLSFGSVNGVIQVKGPILHLI